MKTTRMEDNPDSDDQNRSGNNNISSVNVNNNYFDKIRNSSLEQPILEEQDDDEEEEELGSGSGVEEDYSDYEENIEEFVSVNNSTESAVNNSAVMVGTTTEGLDNSDLDVDTNSTFDELLPVQEELVQPDQIRNVVQEISTATEIIGDEDTNDWPRTEALIGIRPYSEGSGNGNSNNDDDEDDDDYDEEEDTDIIKARKRIKNARENSEKGGSRRFNNYNGNLEDEESDEDGSSRFMKNRRFGKNNAIKFISTPHGKVGILYSSTNDETKKLGASSSSGSSSSNNGASSDVQKDIFRGISSDLRPILISNSDSRSNEDRNSGGSSASGKMTPVLTADGKVALLYRGASAENENVAKKYEPIVNYTKSIAAPAPSNSEVNVENRDKPKEEDKLQENNSNHKSNIEPPSLSNQGGKTPAKSSFWTEEEKQKAINELLDQEDAVAPPKMEDNNFLPILDRPLSELLGLKKHQFTHFRVTEPATTTPIPQVNMRGKLPSNYDYDFETDYNGVSGDQEILTKTEVVNLAIVPSLTQEHNSVVHHKGNAHFRKHRRIRLEDLSNVHCAMQAMVAVAALACIFGMLGAYFKNRILDTQVPTYRL